MLFFQRVSAELGGLAALAQGAHAAGADVQADADTIDHDALLLHVGAKIAAGAALGETYITAKGLRLTAYITLPAHGLAPFNT